MGFKLLASMMCASYWNLEKEVRDLEEGGIEFFHIDIMDGRYVRACETFSVANCQVKCNTVLKYTS